MGDRFEITDRKREFFNIDTSQYMNYDFHDLGHEYHAHHGPQPVRLAFVLVIVFSNRTEKPWTAHG